MQRPPRSDPERVRREEPRLPLGAADRAPRGEPWRSAFRLVGAPRTEPSGSRSSRFHPFPSEQFHALLNSLFKVLCNFPSRYLFAIGLAAVFSLGWSLPPLQTALPSSPTPKRSHPRRRRNRATTGLAPAPATAPLRRTCCPVSTRNASSLTPHFPAPTQSAGFGGGLFRVRSPLLTESQLVSFPPLIDMLKSSGSSRLI